MSADTVISVENLGKSYLVGHQAEERDNTLRDALVRSVRNFGRQVKDITRGRQLIQGDSVEEFWALRDLTFEVKQGEVLGIMGRNGAGKSTLLKLLSRITPPTTGRAHIKGRLASLLEVGTGFHPELSGRENIYLNGAILGMKRKEIRSRFDEIVQFAGVEKFLDTPVKRYSSGMYVRLAFAVAAHLEPEILIIDEVLAVGDIEFQRRCLGKMRDVAQSGRTVLLVSHQINSLRSLATRGMILEGGYKTFEGPADDAIHHYTTETIKSLQLPTNPKPNHHGVTLTEFRLEGLQPDGIVRCGQPANLTLAATSPDNPLTEAAVGIYGLTGGRIAHVRFPVRVSSDTYQARLRLDPLWFYPGIYTVNINLFAGRHILYSSHSATALEVADPLDQTFPHVPGGGGMFMPHTILD